MGTGTHAVRDADVLPSQDNDLSLLQRIAARDRRALERLYMRYHSQLYQFLFRMVNSPHTAEELINDVFFVVWDKAGTFKGGSKVSTWMFGIAYRKALKANDYRRRRPDLSHPEEPDNLVGREREQPETRVYNEEFHRHLKTCIAELAIEHRSVVELTALGYSYKEIGKIVECPENTVKTRMFYARRELQTRLAELQSSGRS